MSQDWILPLIPKWNFLPFQGVENPFFPGCPQTTPDYFLSIGDVLCTFSGGYCAPESDISTILTRCSSCEPEPHGTLSCDFDTSANLASKESQYSAGPKGNGLALMLPELSHY